MCPLESLSFSRTACGCLSHSSTHHRLRGEDVGAVLVDELLHSLLPHLEHLGSSVLHQGELLQHDFFGSLDLFSQVELGRLWLRLVLLVRDISAEIKTNPQINQLSIFCACFITTGSVGDLTILWDVCQVRYDLGGLFPLVKGCWCSHGHFWSLSPKHGIIRKV